ncbi:MAG: ATP-binding cassette domain-containing protein [Oscillospiraceae bacterium]|nr:ATP-binding cassette domain-containing protein [Oscillospiraceae bacterium]
MEKIIEVKGLAKSFKKHQVLKGVNFHIYKGKIFALLGSNGAGKTTCVRILSTLAKADSGSVTVCGYDAFSQADEVKRCISLTGQYAAVDEVLTARENLHLIGELKRLPDTKKQADELLAIFALEEDADRQVATYSGGMRRRLDIAMSLMGKPPIIFLDEPTTGLDPQNRIAMWDLIAKLAEDGATILLTTQYLEEAEYLADHIAILHDGIITAEGSPEELKKILPIGEIVLEFALESEKKRASEILKGHSIKNARKSIEISTDGTVSQLAEILNRLNSENVQVARFTQNQPSLEDAFLTLIGERK